MNRYYDLSEGKVKIDDVDLKDISLKSLRQSIGYVSQEPVLILGTIRDNLMFGDRDSTEKQMEQALNKANA